LSKLGYHTFKLLFYIYQDPLRWNGHWFSYAFISRPSTKAMVIDLSYQGPLQRKWSLIFQIQALCKSNGHRSFISRPSAKAMVIDLSYQGPLQKQWSSIFHIKALYKGNGHWSFISRPSTKAMVIDLSYQDPLWWNGHWFSYDFISRPSAKAMVVDLSYRDPLQKQWSSIFHIKALCKGNGHSFS